MLKRKVQSKAVEKPKFKQEQKGKIKDDELEIENQETMKIHKGERKIGLSKGMTINLGNYQSAKISVWMERIVEDDNHSSTQNLQDMSQYLDDWLQSEVDEIQK